MRISEVKNLFEEKIGFTISKENIDKVKELALPIMIGMDGEPYLILTGEDNRGLMATQVGKSGFIQVVGNGSPNTHVFGIGYVKEYCFGTNKNEYTTIMSRALVESAVKGYLSTDYTFGSAKSVPSVDAIDPNDKEEGKSLFGFRKKAKVESSSIFDEL